VISPLIHCPGYITNKPTVKIEYVKYDFAIHELYGVQIVGLPSDIKLVRASLWNLETVCRVHAGLKEGSVCWVKMTKTEHKALIAKHNTLRAESASESLRQRATRSDKGTRRKKTGEKEGTGRVQPTARAAFAGTASGGGAVVPLTTDTPINPTPALVRPTAAPVDPTAPPAAPAAPVDLTSAPAAPAAPVDPTPVSADPTPASVDPTPAPVDPSLAFNMHLDPAVLEELLNMPPYKGPLLLLDIDDVNMQLFNIPQDPPAPITDYLPILPLPKLSPPASPVPRPSVSLDSVLNSLEGLGTAPSSEPSGSLRCNRDDNSGSGSGALPAKKVRKERLDKGVRQGENTPPAPAQPTKPCKTRSDKGVRRGPRAS
jgi:hypothetical protein